MICIQATAAAIPAGAARRTKANSQGQRAAPVAAKLSARSCMASTSALVTRSASSVRASRLQASSRTQSVRVVAEALVEFIKGVKESSVPDVKLTRSRDGESGTAVFYFENPDVFEVQSSESKGGDITGMYLSDEEGTMSTVDVSARFVNGKPKGIEAKYVMKSAFEWDRFMRFMERYAEDNALGFSKS